MSSSLSDYVGTEGDRFDDTHSFATAFERHRARLNQVVRIRLHPLLLRRIDPDDAIQEVYLAARQRLEQWNHGVPVSFFTWLRSITIQTIQNLHRFHFAQRRALTDEFASNASRQSGHPSAQGLFSSLTSPSQHAIRVESQLALHEAMLTIPEGDREIILLRSFEELSNAEVAEALGITGKAASIRYVRAIDRLRRQMESNENRDAMRGSK